MRFPVVNRAAWAHSLAVGLATVGAVLLTNGSPWAGALVLGASRMIGHIFARYGKTDASDPLQHEASLLRRDIINLRREANGCIHATHKLVDAITVVAAESEEVLDRVDKLRVARDSRAAAFRTTSRGG